MHYDTIFLKAKHREKMKPALPLTNYYRGKRLPKVDVIKLFLEEISKI